ncbi:glycosyltransferase family 2 protein (plasmid) [Cetobacterium somerae]|uniref:glycosyltransferase family 2 protein n=1 Tax=Cetobacterium somerae TaxID=188913 RepID=UPI003D766F26
MEKGLVSIVTPIYNSEKYIEETYESIKSQTYKNWEWIVIDDCSKDSSLKLLKNISENDERVKLFVNEINLKAAKTRNKGLDKSNGEFICFIDSDDLWERNFLDEQINFIFKTKAEVVFSSYERVSENLEKSYGVYRVPSKITLKDLLKTNYMSCLTTLYRKDTLGEFRFNGDLKMHEDYVMWMNFLDKCKFAYGNNKKLAKYRIREGSVSRNKIKNLKYMFHIFFKVKQFNILKTFICLLNYIYYGLKKNKEIALK